MWEKFKNTSVFAPIALFGHTRQIRAPPGGAAPKTNISSNRMDSSLQLRGLAKYANSVSLPFKDSAWVHAPRHTKAEVHKLFRLFIFQFWTKAEEEEMSGHGWMIQARPDP